MSKSDISMVNQYSNKHKINKLLGELCIFIYTTIQKIS